MTIRNKIHDLVNYYNKISMGSIVTRELLSSVDYKNTSTGELESAFKEAVTNLKIFEDAIMEANKILQEIQTFIKNQTRCKTNFPPEVKDWHDKLYHAAFLSRKALLESSLTELSEAQVKETVSQAIEIQNKIGEYVIKADEVIEKAKKVIYRELAGETEIP
ncbi:MAG: hypothetical protein HY209_01075 [Candidatus Omnitrophica bacterium]|nr:hypothetical protein [Candidatus Omnitrophota bacterium]